jgi:hypothetical protein
MQSGKLLFGTQNQFILIQKNKYIALTFGDVNELNINGVLEDIYPHQLKITDESDIKVEILNSILEAESHLIEGKYDNQISYFELETLILKSEVFLKNRPLKSFNFKV